MESVAPALTPQVEITVASCPGRTVVQLVNTSGHFGNSYYEALPVFNIALKIPVNGKISDVRALRSGASLPVKQAGDVAEIVLPVLNEYEAIVIH